MRRRRSPLSCGLLIVGACASPITPIPSTPVPVVIPEPAPAAPSPGGAVLPQRGETEVEPVPTIPVVPSAPAPPGRTSWRAAQIAIDSLLDQPFYRTSTWSALVLNANGDTMYTRNAGKLMIPASNMKVVTAAVALVQLGANFKFRPNAVALVARDTVPSDFGPMYDTIWLKNRTLGDALPIMLKQSQNRLAEQIFKTVALERTRSTRRDSSIAVTQRQMAQWQVPSDGYIIYDGSGYDRANYLSSETLTRILFVMRNDSTFVHALPIAGIDGTLIRRMRATRANNNAMAKTGSLFSIRSLSGYLTTAAGEQLIFSLMCNAYTIPGTVVTATMDSVVARLADISERR